MKKQFGSDSDTNKAAEYTFPASAQYVKLQGRHLSKNGSQWLLHSGSSVEFTVTGTEASIALAGDSGINSEKDLRPRYAVYVDGELILDKTMDTPAETVTLFRKNGSATASVKVMMLSEAAYGAVGVTEIKVTSCADVPVKPLPQNEMCIEFIGDSITCAYGVEGKDCSEEFKTTTENFSKSYAYLAAAKLGADYSAVCYSGHGIVSGYTEGEKDPERLVPNYYPLASKRQEYAEEWDFSHRPKDAVVINLGTNDINYVNTNFDAHSGEFRESYTAFLKTVREKNPGAAIICTIGVMDGLNLYPVIEAAAAAFSAETGDKNIFCFRSEVQDTEADGIGSNFHPSEITQQKNGSFVADKIINALAMKTSEQANKVLL